jgi:hypothetical protein
MTDEAVLVAALWVAPERATYFTLPRRLLEPHRPLPPVDPNAPGTFRYADSARFEADLELAGLRLVHSEDLELAVMEAETVEEGIAWVRAFGLGRLLEGLAESAQRTWERELAIELEGLRREGLIRLGGVTRIVTAQRL